MKQICARFHDAAFEPLVSRLAARVVRGRKSPLFAALWSLAALLLISETSSAQTTTTIITHGFTLSCGTNKYDWMKAMGDAIIGYPDNTQGAVLYYVPATGQWVLHHGTLSPSNPVVLIFNWVAESDGNVNLCSPIPGNNIGYAEAAGDALYAALRDPRGALTFNPLTNRTVHFIGHSRGCSVNSECVHRLAAAGIAVDQVTTLDPHPCGVSLEDCNAPLSPTWGDLVPTKWANVTWADNYWRADTNDCDFDGMYLPGVYNVALHNFLGDNSGIDVPSCQAEHTKIHAWYFGTIDTDETNPPDECNIDQDNWYTNAEPGCPNSACSGFHHSALRGGPRPSQPPGEDPGTLPIVYNGFFTSAYSGWLYHGGGGDGDVVNESGTSNWYLRLDPILGSSRSHNRFYLPNNAVELKFRMRTFSGPGTTLLQARLLPVGGGSAATMLFIPEGAGGAWQQRTWTLGSVPRGVAYRLEFSLYGPFEARLGIDDIEITTGSLSGSDISLGTVAWSEGPGGDNDQIPECGEQASVDVQLCAGVAVQSVRATLSGGGSCAVITDGFTDYGNINAGQCLDVGDFDMQVTGCSCSTTFQLHVAYEKAGVPYERTFNLTRYFPGQGEMSPAFGVCNTSVVLVDDCNGDGVLNSGERAKVRVSLRNTGSATAFGPEAWVSCIPGFDMQCGPNNDVTYPDLLANGTCQWPPNPASDWDVYDVSPSVSGTFLADVYVTYDGAAEPFVIPNGLSLDVAPLAWITNDRQSYDFGLSPSSQNVVVPASIMNYGSEPMTVSALVASHPYVSWAGPPLPWIIPPGTHQAITITVATSGLSCQTLNSHLQIVSTACANDPGSDDYIRLSGFVCDSPAVYTVPGVTGGVVDVSGYTIAFRADRIYAYDIASQSLIQVTSPAGLNLGALSISTWNGHRYVCWSDDRNWNGTGQRKRDVFCRDLETGVEFVVAGNAMEDERVVGMDGSRIAFIRSFRDFFPDTNPGFAFNLWIYDLATQQYEQITSFSSAGGIVPVESVYSGNYDCGEGMLAWEEVTVVPNGTGTSWAAQFWRWRKRQLVGGQCWPMASTCAVDPTPTLIAGIVSSAGEIAAASCRVYWRMPDTAGDYQIFVWSACQGITQITTAPFDHEEPTASGPLLVYNRTGVGAALRYRNVVENVERVVTSGNGPGPRIDGNLVAWSDQITSEIKYAFIHQADPAVLGVSVGAEQPYPGDPLTIHVQVSNVAAFPSGSVVVELFEGGTPLGAQTIQGGLPAYGQDEVVFTNVTLLSAGTHSVCARVSMATADNPTNNEQCLSIEVHAPGACCQPSGTCVIVTPSQCSAISGSYQGDATACTCPVLTGACCLPDESCVGNLTQVECTGIGGSFHGIGSTCATTACSLDCPADTNGDATVNVTDLLAVIGAWGGCPAPCPPNCTADIVPDCTVNVSDLLAIIAAWGTCP